MRRSRCQRGAISVFLCLILLPTMIFGGLVTDAARIYGSRSLISEAGELTMNAGLSHYDAELKDDYGLMAMEQTPESMQAELEQYFLQTLNAKGIAEEGAGALIDLKCDRFESYNVDGSQVYLTEVERQQILEYMKYRAPVCLGDELLRVLDEIKGFRKQTDAMEKQMEFAESMDKLQETCRDALDQLDGYREDVEGLSAEAVNTGIAAAKEHYAKGMSLLFLCDFAAGYTERAEGTAEEREQAFLIAKQTFGTSFAAGMASDPQTPENSFAAYLDCLYWGEGFYDTAVGSYVTALRSRALEEFQAGQRQIQAFYTQAEVCITDAENIGKALEEVQKAVADQRKSFQSWKTSIDNLDNEDMKGTMQQEADEKYGHLLDADGALESLMGQMENNRTVLEGYRTVLEQTAFCGDPLADHPVTDSETGRYLELAHAQGCTMQSKEGAGSEADGYAESFLASNFTAGTASGALYSVEPDPYYQALKDFCDDEATPEEKAKGETAKRGLEGILAAAGLDGLTIEGVSSPENWDSKPLPTDLLHAAGANDNSDSYEVSDSSVDGRSDRKKIFDGAGASLDQMNSFLDVLSGELAAMAEDLIIMEYGVQMFSYYTVDKDENGNKITGEITSISGDDLTDNAMYKAEVEYMLWGDRDAEQNIKKTRMLLYGIRLACNMIYAFSDGEIAGLSAGLATVLSCGFPPLVPVFQVVVKVAVAVTETAWDVSDLMNGKGVGFLKNAGNNHLADIFGSFLESLGLRHLVGNAQPNAGGLFYRDYLSVFLLVNTLGSLETKTLARIADCIQLNVDMDITEGYTMLALGADVQSRTTFLSQAARLPDGNHSRVVEDWYQIPYQSILGY